MEILEGIIISRGIVIGRAYLIKENILEKLEINYIDKTQVENEIKRLEKAISEEQKELEEVTKKGIDDSVSNIFRFYQFAIYDIAERCKKIIEEENLSAESAIYKVYKLYSLELDKTDSKIHKERKADIRDIAERIVRRLIGEDLAINFSQDRFEKYIIVAREILPSQVVDLQKDKVVGIVTEAGGSTSHAAILAHQMGIPAIFGVNGLMEKVKEKSLLILEATSSTGSTGKVIIDPTEQVLAEFSAKIEAYKFLESKVYYEAINSPSQTLDGTRIFLMANVSDYTDLALAKTMNVDGIGLLRTEVKFIKEQRFLSEEEQLEFYRKFLEEMDGKPVYIRLLDMGGDKLFDIDKYKMQPNPFLGARSIRILLQEVDKLKDQVRAILRASKYGNAKIMVPMVSTLEEIWEVRKIVEECKRELKNKGEKFNENIEVGIMVETPSAALMARVFTEYSDFFSIGSNDLVQYTLAVDRNNENVAKYYQPLNPAVIRLIKYVVRIADIYQKPVSICGEIAGEPLYTRFLLSLGFRRLSMAPSSIPEVKHVIINTHIKELKSLWNKIKDLKTSLEIEKILETDLQELYKNTGLTL